MKILIICVLISVVFGEKPAPYPPSGWKPQGARLELPSRQYGVPRDPNQVEITTSINEHIPPATSRNNDDDFLQVQGLPAANSFSQFNNQQRSQKILSDSNNGQHFLLSPAFAPSFASTNNNNQQLRQQQQQQQFFQNPKNDAQQLNFNVPPQLPSRQYGVPFTPSTSEVPSELTTQQPPQIFPPPQDESEEDDDDQRPVVAIANAEAHANGNANLLATTRRGQFGQYYILLPDSSLQKVRYATGQTEDDRTINGFSAQLKYTPVEAIKDPVFGYDQQGKIVRLYK